MMRKILWSFYWLIFLSVVALGVYKVYEDVASNQTIAAESGELPKCASIEALQAIQSAQGDVEVFDLVDPIELPENIDELMTDSWEMKEGVNPVYSDDYRLCSAIAFTSAGRMPMFYRFQVVKGVSGEERSFVEWSEAPSALHKRASEFAVNNPSLLENMSVFDAEKYESAKELGREIFATVYEDSGVSGIKYAIEECYISAEEDARNNNMHAYCIYFDSYSCAVLKSISVQSGFPQEEFCTEKRVLTRIDSSFSGGQFDPKTVGEFIMDGRSDALQ